MAHNFRIENIASCFSPSRLRNSLRRSSSASTSTNASYSSANTTPLYAAIAISNNNIISRQPSLVNLEEERKSFGSELSLLEPRPVVYWGSVDERMG
ncbi:hypothetical protein F66182_7274 [Fusarium sp. NRRL 66182]|nr:hypothetical protein F66182_7274 [Fusarium sp. NRRL 66182]